MQNKNEMEFKKYSSIDRDMKIFGDSYSTFMEYLITNGYSDVECIAQQKVHGANFGITINDEGYRANKRSAFLSMDEGFCGNYWVGLAEKAEPNLRAIYKVLKREYPSVVQIKFSGELAGGTFDGKSTTQVQGGTNYSLDQFLYFFDIRLFLASEDSTEMKQLVLNPLDSVALFEQHGLYHAKLISVPVQFTKFERVVNFVKLLFGKKTVYYNTILPLSEWIKYEDFTNNVAIELSGKELSAAEGIVIKSVDVDRMYCGQNRIIIKKINPVFAESNKGSKKVKQKNQGTSASAEATEYYVKAKACVTSMRLDKVCGNHGIDESNFDSKKDFGRLSSLLLKDIIDDLSKDGVVFDPTWMKYIKGKLNSEMAKLIVSKLVNKKF